MSTSYARVVQGHRDREQQTLGSTPLERRYAIGASSLFVRFGDITTSNSDVLVSSDDYLLSAGGGVSAAIARAGGHAVMVDAAKFEPLSLGDVVVTTAGALPAKYVFHVVTIGPSNIVSQPTTLEAQITMLTAATRRCMALTRTLGMRSIAFPAIGAGVANMDLPSVAAAMADVIASELLTAEHPLSVEIHLASKTWQNDLDYIVFFEELAARVRTPLSPIPATSPSAEPRPVPPLVRVQRDVVRVESEPPTVESNARLAELREEFERVRLQEKPIHLFVSYAHEDADSATVLMSHLSALRHEGLAVWSDQRIEPGEKWDDKIREAIETADIGIYLVSHWFLSSEYCVGVEWKRALERQEEGSMRMIPVILSPCLWTSLVGHIQVLPAGGVPVRSQADVDQVYFDIVSEVKSLAQVLQASRV